MNGKNLPPPVAEKAMARLVNDESHLCDGGCALDAPDHHTGGCLQGQSQGRPVTALHSHGDQRVPAPPQAPLAVAAPPDTGGVATVAPRNPAEFLGTPFQGSMRLAGGAAGGAAPFPASSHFASHGPLHAPTIEYDGQMYPPPAATLHTGSWTTAVPLVAGPAAPAGGEIELPAPHDPDQVAAFWRLMGASGSAIPPHDSLTTVPTVPPQMPLLDPAFPPELALAMDIGPGGALEAAVKAEEEDAAAKEDERLATRRRQLRESQARLREKKRKEEKEAMERITQELELVRAQTAASRVEQTALLAVQREYCRHLAMRTEVLNALDPAWQTKQRESASAVPWAVAVARPSVHLPRASGFDEVVNYARQHVLKVRLAVEDALENGLDAETVAAVEAAVRGGPDPRTAFLDLVRTRESFYKALSALESERPQPCADEGRWAVAAAAVVGHCPPEALLRLRRACSRAEERRKCVLSALGRVGGDLDRLLPADVSDDGSAMPSCWVMAAKVHLDTAALASTLAGCFSEVNQIFQDIAEFFTKELGVFISALVIAYCEPDWPNWPAVASQAVALAEQRGIIPPPI